MEGLSVLLSIAGCGGLAAIFYLFPSILSKLKPNKINPMEIFQQKQKVEEEIIKNNYQDSVKLETKIKTIDKITVEKKKEINEVVDNASKKIEEIMKKESIADIQQEIDDGWEDI